MEPQNHHQSIIQKELECAICLKQFVSPRFLPCLHTFCSSPCLQSLCESKKEGDQVSCPICRKEAVIPKDGFPLNFFAQNFAQILPLVANQITTNQVIPTRICDECEEGAEDSEAVSFCKECEAGEGVYLCNDHTENHKSQRKPRITLFRF